MFCYFRLFSVFFRFHFFKKNFSSVFHTLQPLIGILFFTKIRLLSVLFEYRMLCQGVLRHVHTPRPHLTHTLTHFYTPLLTSLNLHPLHHHHCVPSAHRTLELHGTAHRLASPHMAVLQLHRLAHCAAARRRTSLHIATLCLIVCTSQHIAVLQLHIAERRC